MPSVTSVALGTTVASAKASSIKRPPVSATPTPPPAPPTQPPPPSAAVVAPTSAASVVSSAASRTSSFAAALRNLAKNATSVANEPPNVASVASPASVAVPEPPALLDVRRVSHFYTQEWLLQSDRKKMILTSLDSTGPN